MGHRGFERELFESYLMSKRVRYEKLVVHLLPSI
jgi:hypothetical protein